jgi:AcrR family transcriptional regulator
MRQQAARRSTSHDDPRAAIVAAARRCFGRFGVDKTTIDDITREAKIARSALYRAFYSREDIIEAVIFERATELAEEFKAVRDATTSFAEALVETSLVIIHAGRRDPELHNLINTHAGTNFHDLLVGPRPHIHLYVFEFWKPELARARAQGLLRDTVTDDDVIEWLINVWIPIILNEEITEEAERTILENFLLPSLLA